MLKQIPQYTKFVKNQRKVWQKPPFKKIKFGSKKPLLCKNSFALVSLEKGFLTLKQINTLFFFIQKKIKKIIFKIKSLSFFKDKKKNFKEFNFVFYKKLIISKNSQQFSLSKILKKKFLFFYPNAQYSVTKKQLGIRMGKGKGSVSFWGFSVNKGFFLLQLRKFLNPFFVFFILFELKKKLPIKTAVLSKKTMILKNFSKFFKNYNLNK